MEVNFENQKPCIPSWPAFSSLIFFLFYFFSKSMCISVFGPFSSTSSSLVILFIHSAFLLCFFWLPYFCPKSFGFFCIRLLACFRVIVDRIFFRCFGMSCFVCIVLPFVDISLIFLLSPALSCLFSQVVLLFLPVLPVPFYLAYFSASLFFIILACFRSFFICVSSGTSHPGFDCFFVLFEGIPIFSQTNFAPA